MEKELYIARDDYSLKYNRKFINRSHCDNCIYQSK